MSLSASAPPTTSAASPVLWRTWLLRAFALAGVLALLLYGLAAVDAGIVNYRAAGNAEIAAQRLALQQAAEAGQLTDTPARIAEHSSVLLGLLSHISSPTYTFGKQGLSEPLLHYATMPRDNAIVLSMHNVLGGVCMLFGALQFWPAFRRRFPLWHRSFGAIYLLAAQAAMIASMVYLARTPVAQIYDHLTFYFGLWSLAIGVTFTLWMAVHAMWRRQIAQHQAWMSLNYGMLLTAPIQRFGWLALGHFSPGLRQLEANYAVTGALVPLCVLIGYGLFTVNRWTQADRSPAAQQKVTAPFASHRGLSRAMAWLALPVLGAAVLTTLTHLVWAPGLTQVAHAPEWIPAGVIAMEDAAIAAQPLLRWTLAAATVLGLLAGARLVWAQWARPARAPSHPSLGASAWLLAACAAVVGLVQMRWGWQMGMPSFATLAGGTLYLFGGACTLLFAAMTSWALAHGRTAWAKEWSVFLLAFLLAIPSFYWLLPLFGHMGAEPQYVQAGHVFRMAAITQWLWLTPAFVLAAYGDATHGKFAR